MMRFTLEISYSQVCAFDARLDCPFNDWTDSHVAQGFAWRRGSVSFGTLEDAGQLVVDVHRDRNADETSSTALRIIHVPFSVAEHRQVEIASIGSSAALELPPGEYELIFAHGRSAQREMWAEFYFRAVDTPVKAKIVRADAGLSPPRDLVMTADPAH